MTLDIRKTNRLRRHFSVSQHKGYPSHKGFTPPHLSGIVHSTMHFTPNEQTITCAGPCARCGREHTLPAGPTPHACHELMRSLETHRCIDWHRPPEDRDPRLSTKPLFGEARGQMFGIMAYRTQDGEVGNAKAFSGQFNGVWDVDGWAPPLIDETAFWAETSPIEREIKRLGRRMAALEDDAPLQAELNRERKTLSRQLMREIHEMYELPNFRGRTASLFEAFNGRGIPTGTADCCAPKLLALAARQGWRPIGLAEFFWGRENRSGTRSHGSFYPACEEKCRPILGYMLCGLDNTP